VIDPAAGETESAGGASPGRHSQLIVLLAALGDVAFTGAVAVHVAFADGSRWAVALVSAATVAFVAATIVALVARRTAVVFVAAVVIALAGVAAAVVAVDAGRRYDALRGEAFGGRAGVRLVEPDSAAGRRMGGAMLSGIAASLAAITAFPLPPYFVYRAFRRDR
jgi:hypothetical protein